MSEEFPQIRLLMLDVDGVMTDGSVVIDHEGREIKRFHARDGLGLKMWMKLGLEVAVVSGRDSPSTTARFTQLGITNVQQGIEDKLTALKGLCAQLGVSEAEVACMGDDLPDLPPMRQAGYSIAVADADRRVCEVADFTTNARGGRGAVREAIEHLLEQMGRLDEGIGHYDSP